MNPPASIPLLDQVAADCLRGMLADHYFKPDVKRDGAVQAYQLARALLQRHDESARKRNPAMQSLDEYEQLRLIFGRAALSGLLANPFARHASPEAWAEAAHEWADAMLTARTTA